MRRQRREWPREWISTYATVSALAIVLPGVFVVDAVAARSVVVEGALVIGLGVGLILFELLLYAVFRRLDERGDDRLLYGFVAGTLLAYSLLWYRPVVHLLG